MPRPMTDEERNAKIKWHLEKALKAVDREDYNYLRTHLDKADDLLSQVFPKQTTV